MAGFFCLPMAPRIDSNASKVRAKGIYLLIEHGSVHQEAMQKDDGHRSSTGIGVPDLLIVNV
ncbi:hypothetical protein [Rhodococcus sp. GOMB7]|uniref:hypothetical protein n=1 Tax=Rhodococcus sp. GOMB7 TaxID=2839033 RepID=UPI002078B5A5|nr:hypothetical protein [Rhodococcus sp. GOMB7]